MDPTGGRGWRGGISRALGVAYVLILWLPLAQMTFRFFPEPPARENRNLAGMPMLSGYTLSALERYAEDFERYFNDRFGLRNSLVQINNMLMLRWLYVSPNPQLLAGKDGWLYYNARRSEMNLVDFCGLAPFSAADLAAIIRNLQDARDWLAAAGVPFYLVVAPNKQSIYPEFLPDRMRNLAGKTRLDQLMESVRDHPALRVIDLRAILREAKGRYPTYYRTDTHWNEYGALVAVREILRAAAGEVRGIQIPRLEDYTMRVKRIRSRRDLTGMLALRGLLRDERIRVRHNGTGEKTGPPVRRKSSNTAKVLIREIPGSRFPRLVMFRDSFAVPLVRFLEPCFSRSVFVWEYPMDGHLIEEEMPDMVVLEVAERMLGVLARGRIINPPP